MSPVLPPQGTFVSLVTVCTAAKHCARVFIKLSAVIHSCLPPEVTHHSKPIGTRGTGGLNCSFQDMLPCVGPLRISFATERSNYSAQRCPSRVPWALPLLNCQEADCCLCGHRQCVHCRTAALGVGRHSRRGNPPRRDLRCQTRKQAHSQPSMVCGAKGRSRSRRMG